MDLAEMRTRVRRDLKDEDAASYRWSNNEIDRHIDHALRELSMAAPLQSRATISLTAGSRDIAVSSLTGLIAVEAVEYPVGVYPPCYVPYALWGSTLSLLIDATPSSGESANVFYGKLHTLDVTSSTLPSYLEDLLAVGAEAYAAIEWASFAANRVNVGGANVSETYLIWGKERLTAFRQGLASQGEKASVRVRQLYHPPEPRPSQSTDWGP